MKVVQRLNLYSNKNKKKASVQSLFFTIKLKLTKSFFFSLLSFLKKTMYQPPPGQKSEYDQYPLQDTQFTNQPPITRSPFDDDRYPADNPPMHYDQQPLLHNPPSYPPSNVYPPHPGDSPYPSYPGSSPSIPQQFNPPSPNMHYGEAPRRQPRRFKTSKF